LSDNEELSITQLCHLLGSMGYEITCDELEDIVSNSTNWQNDECEHVNVSEKLCVGFLAIMVNS